MSEEILVNVTPQETRVAIIENGVLQEVHIERIRTRGIVGNIYKGKVVRILPGMQAAFVDIGLERTAFLHVVDVLLPETEKESFGETPSIDQVLHEGQEIMVQVSKDPMGTKGARLTMCVTMPARYLVYLPSSNHIGVSQKIEGDETRERLRQKVISVLDDGKPGGFILRTMAEKATDEELRFDIRYLRKAWDRVKVSIEKISPAARVHEELPLALRVLRDFISYNREEVRIDSRETYQKMKTFVSEFIPEIKEQIKYYPGERPIFDLYSIEDEIQKALDRKVLLKSGGYVIIDQTEAMTTIDVNTGAYVGRKSLDETLLKTNLEATQTIARQLRLRNLGGIIIIDFIDMTDDEHKRMVMRALEKAIGRDRSKVHLTDMSPLGLVELTRKRTRESLEHILCESCPTCKGRGSQKSAQTVCYEIFRAILREARQFGGDRYLVIASQAVIDTLLDEEADGLEKLQEFIGKPISLQVEPLHHPEQFDVVLV